MPNKNTFDIKPIRALVKSYLAKSDVSIDPFARNKRWATYTNDLNPETQAEYHMTAFDFLTMLYERGVKADLILFDPPYSLGQVKECYQNYGLEFLQADAQNVGHWGNEKNVCKNLLSEQGVFIHFGWHSNGIGLERGFDIAEMLLVAHGRAHYDTIVTVERKIESAQMSLVA